MSEAGREAGRLSDGVTYCLLTRFAPICLIAYDPSQLVQYLPVECRKSMRRHTPDLALTRLVPTLHLLWLLQKRCLP